MTRSSQISALPLLLAVAACAASGGPEVAPSPEAAENVATTEPVAEVTSAATDAVAATNASFTDDQADRGRDTFRAMCTECHYSSEFSDAQFQFKWSRRSVGDLYQLIHTSMPETAPGSLLPEESVDLVSYILRMNGFEAGSAELLPDREALDAWTLASIRN